MQTLLNLLKWSVIAGAATLALTALKPGLDRRYSGRWRYYVWLVLAVCLILSPLRLGDNLAQTLPAPVTVEVPRVEIPVRPIPMGTEPVETPTTPEPQITVPTISVSQTVGTEPVQRPATSDQIPEPTTTISLDTVLTGIWLAGAAVFALYHMAGTLIFARRARRWSVPASDDTVTILNEVRQTLELGRMPRLRVTTAVDSPMVIGLFRPCLLLPDRQYTDQELALILRHELTHYRRHDLWYKALILAANALHWFNPLIWLMRRQAGTTLELICDDLALSGEDAATRRVYCEVLLKSAHRERGLGSAALSTHFYGGKAVMRERFKNLLGNRKKKFGWMVLIVVTLAVALGACAFGFSETEPTASTQPPSDSTQPTQNQRLPIIAPEGTLKITPTSEGVEDFLAKKTGFTSLYEYDWCYNITPDFVAENSDFTVFKYDESCESFLLYEGEIYALGIGFGGYGITGMALADFNTDSQYELYFTFSWGSGLHRSQLGYFDPATRQVTVFDFSLIDSDMLLTTNSDGALTIHSAALFEMDSFTSFTVKAGRAIGKVAYHNGEVLLLDLSRNILEGIVQIEASRPMFAGGTVEPWLFPTGLSATSLETDVIGFSPISGNVPVDAISENSPFPLLTGAEFSGFAELEIPQLRAWAYQNTEIDTSALYDRAENAARAFWGSCTAEEQSDGMRYWSDAVDTPYGTYQEYLEVTTYDYPSSTNITIHFKRGWLNFWGVLDSQPFSIGVAGDPDTAIALARELAEDLGLGDFAQADPLVRYADSGDFLIVWPFAGDGGISMESWYRLEVTVTERDAVELELRLPMATPVTAQPPAYFLTPEEALYCINYARGLSESVDVDGDSSGFFSTVPYRVELIWANYWMIDYSAGRVALAAAPAYKFTFVTPDSDDQILFVCEYVVDAYTGRVKDSTNHEEYPSPYQLDGYDPYATYRAAGA